VVLALVAAGVIVFVVTRSRDAALPSDPPPGVTRDRAADAGADPRDRIPKIDVHVHMAPDAADLLLEIMDAQGIAIALNASGGPPGRHLALSTQIAQQSGLRIRPYCNVSLVGFGEDGFAETLAASVDACARGGAIGVKISKALGLGYIDPRNADLIAADDPRLDPLFERAGVHQLPILIHTGDPRAFFEPPTAENERFAELSAHPSWSFYGPRPDGHGSWPSWEDLLAQFERRVARHPRTTFVGAHFGNAAEDPDRVERMLTAYPNLVIETGARVPEFGRHPSARMRALFLKFQDRILFGTDLGVGRSALTLGSSGEEPDTMAQVPEFFAAHFRYFESLGARMRHPTPIQGNWTIDGIGLPRDVLERLYHRNAERVFRLDIN
jgi:predicted TIM-barrel fold metal-dependent hydrolase